MNITRHANCAICGARTSEKRDFQATANLLEPDEKPTLSGEIAEQIKEWRYSKIYCEEHRL